jgi:hypothetical protein
MRLKIELRCILFPLIILDVSTNWLESTCGKLNWLDMIWKGTHLDSACQSKILESLRLFLDLPAQPNSTIGGEGQGGDQDTQWSLIELHSSKIVASYPRRLTAVISAKGASTKYWVKGLNTYVNVSLFFPKKSSVFALLYVNLWGINNLIHCRIRL